VVALREHFQPGDIGSVAALHGRVYAAEYGLDLGIECDVATELAAYARGYDPARERWIAAHDGDVVLGSLAIQDRGERAQLRWFILAHAARGAGVGKALLTSGLAFARTIYPSIFLHTFEGLDAAIGHYRKAGFVLTKEHPLAIWGTTINEQFYELRWE
jgi:GNAT superfamily N-acetyltransferase